MAKKIYIGNLNFNTTEEVLKNEFSKYGEVISSTIIVDKNTGVSKGFGFVEIEDDADAMEAISALNGKMIERRRVRVNFAEDKPSRERKENYKY